MQLDVQVADRSEALLIQWMNQYGDDILRTCYLLCGDLPSARQAARHVFVRAHESMDEYERRSSSAFSFLLSVAMRECPCRLLPGRMLTRSHAVSRFLLLPPAVRRAAVLCLYHGLSTDECAQILHKKKDTVDRLIRSAETKLR